MKRCPQCHEEKTLDCFSIRKSGLLVGWCKPCSVRKAQERYRKPGVAERKRQYDKDRRERLKPDITKKRKEAYHANREKNCADSVAWSKRNPSRRLAILKAYKARRRSVEQTGMSGVEFRLWLDRQEKKCHWCNSHCNDAYHVDHVMPLSKGGAHEAWNLVISCPSCNLRKSDKHPLEWLAEIGYARALPVNVRLC